MSRFWGGRAERTLSGLRAFFSTAPRSGEALAAQAEAQVLGVFRSAADEVPAYRRFLAEHGIDPSTVTDLEAFRRLPATTKDNYYRQHPLPELCRHGQLDSCDMVALSSGSTGDPAVWPRFLTDELETSARFEQVLADAFAARERRTLAVICLALGNWVGGMYTLACCRQLAAKGYPLTVVAPGNQPAEILRALRALSPHFEQRVLFGYPPFLKDVLELGQSQGIDFSAPPTHLVMAGEVFSEEWRERVCRLTGSSEPARSTASLYGTADGGVLANETPLSIRIRRALARQPAAARALFGEARLPTLCQYDPRHRFFEVEEGGWLLFSGNGGAPLLRYKILDRGGVVKHAEMRSFLAEHGIELEPDAAGMQPELPFVYVFGRSHFAVSFYGANVYPENVSVGLEQPELMPTLTGKFVLEVQHDAAQSAELVLSVELSREASAAPALVAQIQRLVRQHLERLNSEFANYVPDARRTPRVQLYPFGDPHYFPAGVKHRYTR
ncbi:MAG TPA: phenylacetate--CoA ligase family protein [Polyangiaceae bacterium]|nr:phenylacetate--CoA ligase family protein [Polyangiaceae bacterium]